jgi:hypothetical protein
LGQAAETALEETEGSVAASTKALWLKPKHNNKEEMSKFFIAASWLKTVDL